MIREIDIDNVRGIRHGRLEGLAPLTILTGHNGSGKSSVLDALLIGASPRPGEAVGRAVRRHPASTSGARWLVRDGSRTGVIVDGVRITRQFVRHDDEVFETVRDRVSRRALRPPFTSVEVTGTLTTALSAVPLAVPLAVVALDVNNDYVAEEVDQDHGGPYIRLIDPGIPVRLSESYSKLVQQGRKLELVERVRAVLPAVRDIELLEDAPGVHSLYLMGETAPVPSGLSGDGVHAFLQIAVELASISQGTALLEEPEVYQHPRALGRTAELVVATVQRGVQVVLTTHSLELIDELVSAAERRGLQTDQLALFNLAMSDGDLRTTRRSGSDLAFARSELELDPR